jgi:hypothetical protein
VNRARSSRQRSWRVTWHCLVRPWDLGCVQPGQPPMLLVSDRCQKWLDLCTRLYEQSRSQCMHPFIEIGGCFRKARRDFNICVEKGTRNGQCADYELRTQVK